MSLILDALRKADAERERGSVPSLHSQPVVPPSAESAPQSKARPNWLWITVGVAIGLAAAATWLMVGREAPPPGTPIGVAPMQPGPGPTLVTPAAPSAPPITAPAPREAQDIAEPAPWRQPDERKALRPEAKGAVAIAGPAVAAPAEAVVAREQLPPNIRAELPQFAIGGSMYSPHPGSRSLIVNGQLYRERDRLTQDLSLEEIRLKSAVFSFRGHRFEVLF